MTATSRRPLPTGYRLTPLTEEDKRALLDLDTWAFPSEIDLDDQMEFPLSLTWSRTIGVVAEHPDAGAVPFDGAVPTVSDLAAMHSSYPFSRFPVPGGTLPVSGLTWVGVHPQHRRRGILSAMIDVHFEQALAAGEPLSALFAAEAPIYGRFGYGQAAQDLRLTIPRGAALRDVPGADEHTVRVEHADRARHGALVDAVHRTAAADPGGHGTGLNRPGWVTRETPELQESFWSDPKSLRGGRESRRIVVVERDGEPRGYAMFRRKLSWETTGPRGSVSTGEVVALDAAAARALWGVLTDLDLTNEVEPFMIPVDDVITHLLVDPRAAAGKVADNLWVRVLDVPAALAGRRYAGDLDVVLNVRDERLPGNAGSWRLRASAFGDAECERVDDPADLTLDVRELGAAYLGGVSLASLATAGLVTEHRPGGLAQASAAFGWPVAPVSSWVF
ncbi:GNAT family N-acetyltransferase [Oerskovia turbata]